MTSNMLTKTEVKERGWTEAMIRDYLGESDDTYEMRGYRRTTVKLFLKARVMKAEKSSDFGARMAQRIVRGEAGKRAAARREEVLLKEVSEMPISIEFDGDMKSLEWKAIAAYRAHREAIAWDRGDYYDGSVPDDPQRLMVNYLRHECTDYDLEVFNLFGQVGREKAYRLLKDRMLKEIATQFPALEEECARQ